MTKRKTLTAKQKAEIMEAHDHKCWRCGEGFGHGDKIEFDHKQALARGGSDEPENIGPCHDHCHALKTFGGATKLGADIYEIAKTKRLKAKNDGTFKKSGHKIKSRNTLGKAGFRKKLDGTVVRAEGRAKMS